MKDQYCQEIYLSGCRHPNHGDGGETDSFMNYRDSRVFQIFYEGIKDHGHECLDLISKIDEDCFV
jgi:hypothetical protein